MGTQLRNTILWVRNGGRKDFELGREEVLDEPEVPHLGSRHAERSHHDLKETLVEVSRSQGEDVDSMHEPKAAKPLLLRLLRHFVQLRGVRK